MTKREMLLENHGYLDKVIKDILEKYIGTEEELIDLIFDVIVYSPANVEMIYNYFMDTYDFFKSIYCLRVVDHKTTIIKFACNGLLRGDNNADN